MFIQRYDKKDNNNHSKHYASAYNDVCTESHIPSCK